MEHTTEGDAKMPNQDQEQVVFIDVNKTSEILGLSPMATRQLIHRKKLKFTKTAQGRICIDINAVLTYHAQRMSLPSLDLNHDRIKGVSLVPMAIAMGLLQVSKAYIISLIRKKKLEGYVASDGTIYVSKESVNLYLRAPGNDTNDL